jgi:hypothetical protein
MLALIFYDYNRIKSNIMKRIFLLATVAILFTQVALAQLKFGPEVGLNINKFDYSIAADESNNMGLRIGLTTDIGLGKLSVQPGLFYSMKGGESDYTDVNGDKVELNTNLGYIEVPLLLQYKIGAGPGMIFLGGGPTASIAVTGETKTSTTPAGGTTTKVEEPIEFGSGITQMDRADIGLMLNVGYELNSGLFFRPFYNMGLSNLSNIGGITMKNNTIGISVGYLFGN